MYYVVIPIYLFSALRDVAARARHWTHRQQEHQGQLKGPDQASHLACTQSMQLAAPVPCGLAHVASCIMRIAPQCAIVLARILLKECHRCRQGGQKRIMRVPLEPNPGSTLCGPIILTHAFVKAAGARAQSGVPAAKNSSRTSPDGSKRRASRRNRLRGSRAAHHQSRRAAPPKSAMIGRGKLPHLRGAPHRVRVPADLLARTQGAAPGRRWHAAARTQSRRRWIPFWYETRPRNTKERDVRPNPSSPKHARCSEALALSCPPCTASSILRRSRGMPDAHAMPVPNWRNSGA